MIKSQPSVWSQGALALFLLAFAGGARASERAAPAAPANSASPGLAQRLAVLAGPEAGRLSLRAVDEETLEASLALSDANLELTLWSISNRAPGARAFLRGPDGSRSELELPPTTTYRGRVRGLPGAVVAVSLDERGLQGLLILPEGRALRLEPAAKSLPNAPRGFHVLRPFLARAGSRWSCGLEHEPAEPAAEAPAAPGLTLASRTTCSLPPLCPAPSGPPCGGICAADIAYDTDFELYQELGSSAAAVIAFIDQAVNDVNAIYESQVGISHLVAHYEIRASSSDGYDSCPPEEEPTCCGSNGCLLGQVQDQWSTDPELAAIDRDVVHLFSLQGAPGGSPAGVGYQTSVCNNDHYSWSRQGASGSCVEATVHAHELGHNWGAIHDIAGLMASSPGCSSQFSQCSIDQISCYREAIAPLCLDLLQAAAIAVSNGSTVLANGAVFDYGTRLAGNPRNEVFNLANNGDASLTLANLTVPSGYSITTALPSTLAPGSSGNFAVQLNAGTAGTFNGSLQFDNNDPDDDPFVLSLTGIVVAANSLDPAWVDFAYTGPQYGTQTQPFNSLALAAGAVNVGGTIRLKAGSSGETLTINKAMSLVADNGTVIIGQ